MKLNRFCGLALIGLVNLMSLSSKSFALPACYDDDRKTVVAVNNSDVLQWLLSGSGWHRAMVTGVVVKRLPDQTGHAHFLVDLNGDGKSDIEIIHQSDFGAVQGIAPGANVAVCGDFLKQGMDGVKGFIHWTHCNPGTREPDHPQGWVSVNGSVYGTTAPSGEPDCDPSKP